MTREEMESRRMLAIKYFELGQRQSYVWRKLGVSSMAVSRWYRAWKGGGSLKSTKPTGRPCRMTLDQIQRFRELCNKDGWSKFKTADLAILIQHYFGISYDQDHIGKLMRRLGIWDKEKRYGKKAMGAAA
jgi:transposase